MSSPFDLNEHTLRNALDRLDAELEQMGRERARERLAEGPVYYSPEAAHSNKPWEACAKFEHTEDTLWPYCAPPRKIEMPSNATASFAAPWEVKL